MMKLLVSIISVIFFISVAPLAQATCTPTWCKNAKKSDEVMICGNPILKTADVFMNLFYSKVLTMNRNRKNLGMGTRGLLDDLMREQGNWLSQRSNYKTVQELQRHYIARIKELNASFLTYVTPSKSTCGPSWCKRAKKPDEIMICGNSFLKMADVLMTLLHNKFLKTKEYFGMKQEVLFVEFKNKQKVRLRERSKYKTVEELQGHYIAQIEELDKWLEENSWRWQ